MLFSTCTYIIYNKYDYSINPEALTEATTTVINKEAFGKSI